MTQWIEGFHALADPQALIMLVLGVLIGIDRLRHLACSQETQAANPTRRCVAWSPASSEYFTGQRRHRYRGTFYEWAKRFTAVMWLA